MKEIKEGGTGSQVTSDLLMFDATDEEFLPILLAAAEAEDAGNLEGLRAGPGPWPTPIDNLNRTPGQHLRRVERWLNMKSWWEEGSYLRGCEDERLCIFISSTLKPRPDQLDHIQTS